MLLGEIEGAHRPLLITVEGLDRVFVARLHPVADVTLKEIEHLEELFANLVDVCLLVLLILITDLFEAIVGAVLKLLG